MLIIGQKNILVPGKDFVQGIDGATIYAEKMYSINFSATRSRFCLRLHYNGDNCYLFVNSTEIVKFEAKDSEIVANPLCLGNILKDFSESNMKKTGLCAAVDYLSVNYKVDDILDITSI